MQSYKHVDTDKEHRKETYVVLELIVIQSLKEHGETKEAEMEKAEDNGGGVLPEETTQPNAT